MNPFTLSIEQIIAEYYVSILYILPIIVLLCGIFLYIFRWRDYILPLCIAKREHVDEEKHMDFPRLSVIVPANEQAALLADNLPKLLEQDYPKFEVIVVDEASTDETEEVIKQLQLRYRNLRRTFVPATADICRRKLSITLGVRASRSEWSVVTSASAVPASSQWLRRIAEAIDENTDIILGYGSFVDDGSSYARKAMFDRLWKQLRCYRSAENGAAIGGDEINFCIRKSAFLDQKGYAENLQNDFGESHLLIQKLSRAGNTKVVVHPDATMKEELPLELVWNNMQLYYRETIRQSSRRMHTYLLREGLSTFLLALVIVCVLLYTTLRGVQLLHLHDYEITYVYIDFAILLFVAAIVVIPTLLFSRCTKLLNESNLGWLLIRHALGGPFSNLSLKYRRWVIRKDFVRK